MSAGTSVAPRELSAVDGVSIQIPDPAKLIHLQFRRFAGCPICNLHLRSFVNRQREIDDAGIREVVVFHSTRDELLKYERELPFAIVADPEKKLYQEFAVEPARRSLLDARVWPHILRAVLASASQIVRGRGKLPPLNPSGGRLGLPGDFLIASDGQVLAAKYGEHAYDQWSVDELLELAARRAESFAAT